MLGIVFIAKLIKGIKVKVSSPLLLQRISFNVFGRVTRHYEAIYLSICTTKYHLRNTFKMLRMMRSSKLYLLDDWSLDSSRPVEDAVLQIRR